MDDRAAIPRAFVVGDPISHSRSPLIHRTWLGTYGIAGSYDPISVPAEDFPDFIAGLRDGDARYVGGNVTIPHKEAAFRLVDIRDAACEEMGAVNTVWREDGRLFGSNTDGYGFLANLDARTPGWDRRHGRAVVLGAGGASRAVVASLRNRGFSEIHVLNRTAERGQELARRFGDRVFAHGMDALADVMEGAEFFVNTTSLGMDGTPVPPIDFTRLSETAIVTDIVYVPLETPILSLARTQGIATIDGLGMLLHQAVPGFERWFGVRPEVTEELRDRVIADMRGSV